MLSELKAKSIFKKLLKGIEYLDENNIVHRDIKPANILFDKDMNLKIADFGLAKTYLKYENLSTSCGSPCYAAPEIIDGNSYKGTQVDLWSSGIVLYEMLTGSLPFDDSCAENLYPKIRKANKLLPSIIPDTLSSECKDFLLKLLNTNPEKRLTLREIKRHPWIASGTKNLTKPRSRKQPRRKIECENIRELARADISNGECLLVNAKNNQNLNLSVNPPISPTGKYDENLNLANLMTKMDPVNLPSLQRCLKPDNAPKHITIISPESSKK